MLIPAYNEEAVIATSVHAALASDYPRLEILVLDDGSTDETEAVALAVAAGVRAVPGDPRPGEPRQGGAPERRLRAPAAHERVVVTDADGHLHPQAIRHLVARLDSSPLLAAVAGGPHVTNRDGFIPAMQVLEAAAIIGLIRRTQSLTGRVGTVAGVLAIFHRNRVRAVGGYDGRMATEDIELTCRLLLAGWNTAYEPRALVGMEVPSSLLGTVGAAQALGARAGRGPAHPFPRGLPPAQPPHVAGRLRVARLAGLGRGPRPLAIVLTVSAT